MSLVLFVSSHDSMEQTSGYFSITLTCTQWTADLSLSSMQIFDVQSKECLCLLLKLKSQHPTELWTWFFWGSTSFILPTLNIKERAVLIRAEFWSLKLDAAACVYTSRLFFSKLVHIMHIPLKLSSESWMLMSLPPRLTRQSSCAVWMLHNSFHQKVQIIPLSPAWTLNI